MKGGSDGFFLRFLNRIPSRFPDQPDAAQPCPPKQFAISIRRGGIEGVDIVDAGAACQKHVGDAHDHFAWMKSSFAFLERQSLVDPVE